MSSFVLLCEWGWKDTNHIKQRLWVKKPTSFYSCEFKAPELSWCSDLLPWNKVTPKAFINHIRTQSTLCCVTGQRRSMEMFGMWVKEGMQESLLPGESSTSTSLNNPYPSRQGMSGVFMLSQYFSMTCSIIYSGLAFQFAMPWASVVPALSYQRGNLAANCLPICRGVSEKDPNWQGLVCFFSPFPWLLLAEGETGTGPWVIELR